MSVYLYALDPEAYVRKYIASGSPNDERRRIIVEAYMPMVRRKAFHFAYRIKGYMGKMSFRADLEQVAFIGVIKALDQYDPAKADKFQTYVGFKIDAEIGHFVRDKIAAIRVSSHVQDASKKINKRETRLRAELGRAPTHAEIAKSLGVSESVLVKVTQSAIKPKTLSLNAVISDDDNAATSWIEQLENGEPSVPETLANSENVDKFLSGLDEMERAVIVRLFIAGQTQPEVAAELEIEQKTVRRYLARAKAKLADDLGIEIEKKHTPKKKTKPQVLELV